MSSSVIHSCLQKQCSERCFSFLSPHVTSCTYFRPLEIEVLKSLSAYTLTITCLDTQFLFCLSNNTLCYTIRIFFFSCQDALKKHVKKVHLHHLSSDSEFICVHSACDQNVNGLMHFKNHAATVHKVFLWAPFHNNSREHKDSDRLQLARKIFRVKNEVVKFLHKVFKEFAYSCSLWYIGIAHRTSEAIFSVIVSHKWYSFTQYCLSVPLAVKLTFVIAHCT